MVEENSQCPWDKEGLEEIREKVKELEVLCFRHDKLMYTHIMGPDDLYILARWVVSNELSSDETKSQNGRKLLNGVVSVLNQAFLNPNYGQLHFKPTAKNHIAAFFYYIKGWFCKKK